MKSFIANLIARLANAAGAVINPATEETLNTVRTRLEEIRDKTERIRLVLGDNLTTYLPTSDTRDIRHLTERVMVELWVMRNNGLTAPQYGLIDTTLSPGGSFVGSWIDTRNWGYKNLCFACSTTGTLTVSIQVSHDGSTVLGTVWSGSCTLTPACVTIPYGWVRMKIDNTGTSDAVVRYMHKFFVTG